MKITSIKGRNLASIEGDFSIDFNAPPLKNAGIYAITGPTGSGKSTILDALCLALYGRTPRQKAAKENTVKVRDGKDSTLSQSDARLIMRKGCANAMAEVSFIGMDTHSYIARWSVKRARNNPGGQMQESTMELLKGETGQPIAGKKTELLKEIEQLTGMTFDQFTRSVLLAQGDFTAFLKAEQNEKAELLEKLTGTGIYTRISMLVFKKAKDAITEVRNLENRLSEIKILTDEEIDTLKQKLDVVKGEQKELNDQLAVVVKALDWHETNSRLLAGLADANANVTLTEQYLKDAGDRKDHLHLVELAQDARTIYLAKSNSLKASNERKAELADAQASLNDLAQEIEDSKVKQKEAEDTFRNAQEAYINARPLLARAKELDNFITAKKAPLELAKKALETALSNLTSQKQLLADREKALEQVISIRANLESWHQANEGRRPVADNAPTISARLREAERDLRQLNYHENIAANATSKLKNFADKIEAQKIKLEQLSGQLKPLTEERQKNELLLKEVDKDKLEQEIAVSLKLQEYLTSALTLLEKLMDLHFSNDKLAKELEEIEKKIAETELQLEEINNALPVAEAKKDQAERLLNAARQKITENIEQLRATLKDGEPCPVCGSIHHPYTTGDEVLHTEFSILEGEVGECTNHWMKLLNSRSSAVEALNHLSKEIEKLKLEKDIGGSTLQLQLNRWKSLQNDVYEDAELASAEQMLGEQHQTPHHLTWLRELFALNVSDSSTVQESGISSLQDKIIANRTKTEELYNRNTKLRNLLKNQEELITRIDLLKVEINHAGTELFTLQNQELLAKQELETAGNSMASHKNNLEIIEKELNPWFIKQGWFDAWKTGSEGFINDLIKFTEEWNAKTRDYERSVQQIKNLEIEIAGHKSSLQDKEKDYESKDNILKTLQLEFDQLTVERKNCFEGKDVSIVEMEFTEAETHASKLLEEVKKQQEGFLRQLKTREGRFTQLTGDLQKMNLDLQRNTSLLSDWLTGFNNTYMADAANLDKKPLDEAMLKELLDVPADWIRHERAAMKELEDEWTKAKAMQEERKKQLDKHEQQQVLPLTPEELKQQKESIGSSLLLKTESQAEIAATLKQDGRNRIYADHLLYEKKKLEANSARWQQLDQLIGSSDGRKFRQVAQKYTLEVLLGFANKHLADLTPRYSLEIVPDSLALQVIDHDMGDEIRSVHYLSGGESFLVSLALALALASLSSSRMKVESLFIDEGFGSLDPDTLNTAMDALEKLHNSGRKVGVISHVQEMTERIPVQIRLLKVSGGKSRVVVTG